MVNEASGGQESFTVPVVDVSAFTSDSDSSNGRKEKAATCLVEGFGSCGIVLLSGHGVDLELLRRSLGGAEEFFALQDEAKREVSVGSSGGFTRGYIAPGQESGSNLYEAKEAFSYGFDLPATATTLNGLEGQNRWPSSLGVAWRRTMCDLFSQLCQVSMVIAKAVGLGLKGEESSLAEMCEHGARISLMRCFHYFPSRGEGETGSSAHTDWGFITVILPEPGKTGLELFFNGTWHSVRCPEGYLVANCGDYLSVLSNGRLLSPLHRVVLSERHRISFVLFFYPSYEAAFPQLTSRTDTASASATLSIFQNQSAKNESKRMGNADDVLSMPFGDFILRKWEQVKREP